MSLTLFHWNSLRNSMNINQTKGYAPGVAVSWIDITLCNFNSLTFTCIAQDTMSLQLTGKWISQFHTQSPWLGPWSGFDMAWWRPRSHCQLWWRLNCTCRHMILCLGQWTFLYSCIPFSRQHQSFSPLCSPPCCSGCLDRGCHHCCSLATHTATSGTAYDGRCGTDRRGHLDQEVICKRDRLLFQEWQVRDRSATALTQTKAFYEIWQVVRERGSEGMNQLTATWQSHFFFTVYLSRTSFAYIQHGLGLYCDHLFYNYCEYVFWAKQ